MHIIHTDSWEGGLFLGGLSILVLLKYAIWPRKNTPKASFYLKFSWGLSLIISFLIMVSSFIDGTGLYTEYNLFIIKISLPIILLLLITIIIGAFQKVMRLEISVSERRSMIIRLFITIISIIILTCLIGPFTYDRYYK